MSIVVPPLRKLKLIAIFLLFFFSEYFVFDVVVVAEFLSEVAVKS